MELFRNANIDWLGKKWYFLGFSLIFSVAGVLSMLFWHGIPKGVDFKGGTLVYVKFDSTPNEDHIRQAMDSAGVHGARITRISDAFGKSANEEVIALPESETADASHDRLLKCANVARGLRIAANAIHVRTSKRVGRPLDRTSIAAERESLYAE